MRFTFYFIDIQGGMDINTLKKNEIPLWEKYTLTLNEASQYFGIGYKKLSKFVDEHENENFILWNGSRAHIKRVLFEKYIDEKLTAI